MADEVSKFLFFDDSKQKACKRPKMKAMLGVGGLVIDSSELASFTNKVDAICETAGFPNDEPFKWSPGKNLWMRDKLTYSAREAFFTNVLIAARDHTAMALAVFSEAGSALATAQAETREQDAVYLLLERFHGSLKFGEIGFAVAARPSGGKR